MHNTSTLKSWMLFSTSDETPKIHTKKRNNCTIDVRSEVHLHDIVVLQHSGVTRVWCVMRRTVIQRHSGREGQSSFQSVLLNQFACGAFQFLAKNREEQNNLDSLDLFAQTPPLTIVAKSLKKLSTKFCASWQKKIWRWWNLRPVFNF